MGKGWKKEKDKGMGPRTKTKFMTEYKGCQGCGDGNCKGEGGGNKGELSKVSAVTTIDQEWGWINVTVDSGAVDHVVNQECAEQFWEE